MAAYGVSRFRMNDYTHIPITADFISLVPVNVNSTTPADVKGQGVYVAVDTEGDMHYTVACLLQGQEAKIFLVGDLETWMDVLMNSTLEYTVTEGVVTFCEAIDFVADFVI
jgi:hypothetical protein